MELLPESALRDTLIITDILKDTHRVRNYRLSSIAPRLSRTRHFQALELILSVAHDISKLTVELLFELHSVCMNTTNILPILGKRKVVPEEPSKAEFQYQYLRTAAPERTGNFELKYTNVMLTRQATKKNVVIAGPPRVQFCPFDDVVHELGRFVHLARVSSGL